eukprot:CAMPEP_0170354842 /NCGR_PEP_ID=MMETSP0117_2-20130122/326_1 /TAXON_ID=400756 /ORGANISM="Durinskia baltica, Strain CSIRO CS-38" /LENGTH=137 /DNA_ID=CAMNT_0010608843 /DNA_START=281 /DNA_END=694 /DNA_ORIENTATION=-
MVIKAGPAPVMNGKVIPARGPQHLAKVRFRERRFIRSMVGVDSRNVGVQAELDPEMTLRNLYDGLHLAPPVSTSEESSVLVSSSTSSVPPQSQSDGSALTLPREFDLPSNFASLDINRKEQYVPASTSIKSSNHQRA